MMTQSQGYHTNSDPRLHRREKKTLRRAGTLFFGSVGLALSLWANPPCVPPVSNVPYAELVSAMKECRGYNPLATTNAARFHAEVLLRLARRALRKDPNGGPMVIRQEDWFRAFLEATGVRENETPVWAVLARRHGQDYTVEYRSERIVQYVVRGELPRIVLNVTYSWRGRENPAKEYSYADDLSTPRLRVTNNRTITYRLLDFGDMILFDDIQGLEGRPTSGSLGLLFKLIGNGRLVEFRMSVAPNGTVVARARSRKAFIEIGTTVTVQPDGRSEKGVPSDPVLRELERRVEAPHVIQYRLNPPQ